MTATPPMWSPGYIIGAIALWGLFIAVLFALIWTRHLGWPAPARGALAAIPGLTVAIQFYLAYREIGRQDEVVRALTAKAVLIAAGVTIALATGWSVAEQFTAAPQVPMWLMYPMFWGVFGVVTPMIVGRTS